MKLPDEPFLPGDSSGGAGGLIFGTLLGGAKGPPGKEGRDPGGTEPGGRDPTGRDPGGFLLEHVEAPVVGDENSEGKPGLGSPKRSLGDALETRPPEWG